MLCNILNVTITSMTLTNLKFQHCLTPTTNSDHEYAFAVGRFYNLVGLQNNLFVTALNVARPRWNGVYLLRGKIRSEKTGNAWEGLVVERDIPKLHETEQEVWHQQRFFWHSDPILTRPVWKSITHIRTPKFTMSPESVPQKSLPDAFPVDESGDWWHGWAVEQ